MKRLIFILSILLITVNAFAFGIEQSNPYIQAHKTAIGTVLNANRVAMTAAAAVIKAAPATGHYRYSITIRNLDTTNTVYIGGSGVTAATGYPIKSGESFTLDRNFAAIYGICDTGLTASVAYFEEAY